MEAAGRGEWAGGAVLLLGLGRMGFPIARRMREAGVAVQAWDPCPQACQRWRDTGGEVGGADEAERPAAPTVLLCLPAPQDVDRVLAAWRGPPRGPGTVRLVIDLGTAPPSASIAQAARCAAMGIAHLDAPLTGGSSGAASGQLCAMVGGERPAFERARPLLQTFAGTTVHVGANGSGSRLKAIVQLIYLSYNAAFAHGARLGRQADIPEAALWAVLTQGACAHPLINVRLAALEAGEHGQGFKLWRALKDLACLEDREPACSPPVQWLRLLEAGLQQAGREQGPDADIFDALAPGVRRGQQSG